MEPRLISSQRHLDRNTVIRKATSFRVFVVRTVDVELRGKTYRVLLDGHHNLAAARLAGINPVWKGPSRKVERVMAGMKKDAFAAFLINNLTDCDWYFVDTGEVVSELLSPEAELSSG